MYDPFPRKPKGMRWRTFWELRRQLDDANAFMAWLGSTVEGAFSRQGLVRLVPVHIACLMLRQEIPCIGASRQTPPSAACV
jgi:hypothetical protein